MNKLVLLILVIFILSILFSLFRDEIEMYLFAKEIEGEMEALEKTIDELHEETFKLPTWDEKIEEGMYNFSYYDPLDQTIKIEVFVKNYTTGEVLFHGISTNKSKINFLYKLPDPNATYLTSYMIDHPQM